MDNEPAVIHQMESFGIELRSRDLPLKVDSRRHTCGKGGKFWYRLHEWRPDAGGVLITGAFGSYKSGEFEKVELDLRPLSDAERERRQRERAERERLAAELRAREVEAAQATAVDIWRKGQPLGSSAYLERKRIERPESVRFDRGWLRVPMIRYDLPRDQALQGIQTIKPDGAKLFTGGMAKRGTACRLGLVVAGGPILLCEGYATGMSIRMAIDRRWPVFVCFDAGNVEWVAHVVRKVFPDSPMLVCADDDWLTTDPKNPGVSAAKRVAKQFPRTHYVYPVFSAQRGKKDTDFNDLHAAEGLDAVAAQLRAPLAHLSGAKERRRA